MILYAIFTMIAAALVIGGEFFGFAWMNYLAIGMVLGMISDHL